MQPCSTSKRKTPKSQKTFFNPDILSNNKAELEPGEE